MRTTLIAVSSIIAVLIAGQVLAQAVWHDFSPKQSRLRLIVPGADQLPTTAKELYGDPITKGTRQFVYIWEDTSGKRSSAVVLVGLIAAELSSFMSFSDEDIRKAVRELTSQLEPSFSNERMASAHSPIGAIRYQRVNFSKNAQRQCFAFGDTIGGVHYSAPTSGGISPGGDKYIMGLFCAPVGETLLDSDMTTVLAGLSFDNMKPADSVVRVASDHRYSKIK
jgi:hypothetical protein